MEKKKDPSRIEEKHELPDNLKEALQNFSQSDEIVAARAVLDEIEKVFPYILEVMTTSEAYDGKTIEDILEHYSLRELVQARHDPESEIHSILEAARTAYEVDLTTSIKPYKANRLDITTDKVNLFAWDLEETNGQIKFNLARTGSGDDATALFDLSFDEDPNIKFTKKLSRFDKRVMNVCGTAFNDGHPIISATGIYYAMGGTSKRPGQPNIDKINMSLSKLDMGKIWLDNSVEADVYNYPVFRKKDRLLHFKQVEKRINGKVVDTLIQILEEPVLMTFAKQRKQVSSIPIKILQSPVTMTEKHLKIEDYLIWRIVVRKRKINKIRQGKNTHEKEKQLKVLSRLIVKLSTFYEKTEIRCDSNSRKRARKTASEYLKHYKSDAGGHWIESFKIEPDKDQIIILLPIE